MIQSFYIDISCCCVRDYMVVCYICNMFLSPQNTLTSRHIIEDFSTVNYRKKDGMRWFSVCLSSVNKSLCKTKITCHTLFMHIVLEFNCIGQNKIDKIYCS